MRKNNDINSIILVPITEDEKEHIESIFGDFATQYIYVLFRTPSKGGIQIKKLNSYNKMKFHDHESRAYFYNENSNNKNFDGWKGVPVYEIFKDVDDTVMEYNILNSTANNNLNVWLDDILNGAFQIVNNKNEEKKIYMKK